MVHIRENKGTCSLATRVEIDAEGVIQNVQVVGGCNGNLAGICSLVKGMKATEAVQRMKGILCGGKPTSCPDQIALAIEEALALQNKA